MKTKLKTFLSFAVLVAFAILGGGSLTPGTFIIALFLFICLGIAGFWGEWSEKRKQAKIDKQREETERKLKIERERILKEKAEKYEVDRREKINKFGTPDKTIVIEEFDVSREIDVFEQKQIVLIEGKEFKFSDLMSCKFSDDMKTIKGKITAVTETDTGSAIGGAVVGDIVAGPAGAIIGSSIASKNTEFKQGEDTVIHDYTVIINVNSITNPIVTVSTGEDEAVTNEIVGLMNVIISRNKAS